MTELYSTAMNAFQKGDLDHARNTLARALDREPTNVRLFQLLGQVHGRLGERRACVDAFRRVVDLKGVRDREALTALAIALSNDDHHDEAVRTFEKVVALDPRNASAHADLGVALYAARRFEDAERSFARAAEKGPNCAQAHLGVGIAHARRQRWAEAVIELEQAARLAPTSELAHFNLGLALEASGSPTRARAAYLRAAALAPDDQEISAALDRVLHDSDTSITGDLQTFALGNLLEFLRVETKSGTLTISSRLGTGVIKLFEGRLVSASSPHSQRIKQLNNNSDALAEQIQSALAEIIDWKDGTFRFQVAEHAEPKPAATFDLQYMILELFRRRDEEAGPGNSSGKVKTTR